MENYKILVKLTADDYVNVNKILTLKKPIFKVLLFFAIPAVILLNIVTLITTANPMGFIVIISLSLMYVAIFVIGPNSIRKSYNSNDNLKEDIVYSIDSAKCIIQMGEITEDLLWSDFSSVYETDDYFILILTSNKNTGKVIPKRSLSNGESLQEFSSFIKKQISCK